MPDPLFISNNTQFSAYLIAANLLQFLRAEPGIQVSFVFADPDGLGEDLRRNWHLDAVALVHPKRLLEARNRLVDEIKRLAQ
jgi:hypothetical protein